MMNWEKVIESIKHAVKLHDNTGVKMHDLRECMLIFIEALEAGMKVEEEPFACMNYDPYENSGDGFKVTCANAAIRVGYVQICCELAQGKSCSNYMKVLNPPMKVSP